MPATDITKNIVIADRDVAVVERLRQGLCDVGFVVSAFFDVASAAVAVAERPPHLVIIDWNVPGFMALDLIQRVRAALAPQRTRLIILSALADEQDVVAGFDIGA